MISLFSLVDDLFIVDLSIYVSAESQMTGPVSRIQSSLDSNSHLIIGQAVVQFNSIQSFIWQIDHSALIET